MKNFTRSALVAAALLGLGFQAQAQSVSQDFTVTIGTLTSKCINGSADQVLALGDYEAFQTGEVTNFVDITFTCTNNLPVTVAFDSTSGNSGTLRGLAYTLADPALQGTTADATSGGSNHAFRVTATMAAGQAGDSSTTASTSKTHTLIVSF